MQLLPNAQNKGLMGSELMLLTGFKCCSLREGAQLTASRKSFEACWEATWHLLSHHSARSIDLPAVPGARKAKKQDIIRLIASAASASVLRRYSCFCIVMLALRLQRH